MAKMPLAECLQRGQGIPAGSNRSPFHNIRSQHSNASKSAAAGSLAQDKVSAPDFQFFT
jgi:hypothetical protein